MALDTADKRASSLNPFLPFGRVGPAPDGSFADPEDRLHLAYAYRGIAAEVPAGIVDVPYLYRPRRIDESGPLRRRVDEMAVLRRRVDEAGPLRRRTDEFTS